MAGFDYADTYQKVVDVVAQKLSIEKSIITENSTFQDLGADSLGMVEIIMRFEELFGVEIEDEAAEKLETLKQTVDYIHAKRTK